jgi:hypothetical protein
VRTRDWAAVDYYAVLGVRPDASDDDIARAFRTLAKQLHPDAGVPVETAERFKEVTVAYEVLSNHRRRRDYDAVRRLVVPEDHRVVVHRGPHPDGAPPRFRASESKTWHWTRRWAWTAFVGGLVVTVLGVGVAGLIVGIQHRDAARRDGRVMTYATRVPGSPGEITFATLQGRQVVAREPSQTNPGLRDNGFKILYDPANPRNVIADESYTARNITIWIIAIKFLVGGPVFAALGLHALLRRA